MIINFTSSIHIIVNIFIKFYKKSFIIYFRMKTFTLKWDPQTFSPSNSSLILLSERKKIEKLP